MGQPVTSSRPRSLADSLRQWDDEALGRLLTLRPDLLRPIPRDITTLATRATTGPSTMRCLDQLDALDLVILAYVAEADRSRDGVIGAVMEQTSPAAGPAIAASLAKVRQMALVWGTDDLLHATHAVRDALAGQGNLPVGWPPAELALADCHSVAELDAQAGIRAREVLDAVRELLEEWGSQPPSVLRAGGLAIRDFSAAVDALHLDVPGTALVIEVAHAAGLLVDDHEESPSWVPTDRFDTWLTLGPGEAWAVLATAWLAMSRLPGLATPRTNLLHPDGERRAIPATRRAVLGLMEQAPIGRSVSPESIEAVLDYRQPRRAGALRNQVISVTLAEAAALGICSAGALTTAGRALLDPRGRAAEAMEAALPSQIDQVLIQADLTIVAPGPLIPDLDRDLRLLADVESRGHATVFRISQASLGRAFDAGWDTSKVREILGGASKTSLPQALGYLIDDVGRRYGAVRVGLGNSYIRCDDASTLTGMVNDRRLAALGLSRLADTVIVSSARPAELIEALTAAGYSPAAEGPDGSIVSRPRPQHRAPTPRRVSARKATDQGLVQAAVKALRSSESGPLARLHDSQAPARRPPVSGSAAVSLIKAALAEAVPVWVSYAELDGTTTEQVIDPIRVSAGAVAAFDHRTEQVRTFTMARIAAVALLDEQS